MYDICPPRIGVIRTEEKVQVFEPWKKEKHIPITPEKYFKTEQEIKIKADLFYPQDFLEKPVELDESSGGDNKFGGIEIRENQFFLRDSLRADQKIFRRSIWRPAFSFAGIAGLLLLIIGTVGLVGKGLSLKGSVLGTGKVAYADLAAAQSEMMN